VIRPLRKGLISRIFLVLLGLACLLPILSTINAATLPYVSYGLHWFPGNYLIHNFARLFFETAERFPYARAFFNSLFVATATALVTGYFGLFTAYGFAVFSFRGKKFLWGFLLALMMVPPTVSFLGSYKLAIALNMIDTFWPLILPGIANSYVVFYFRQYLASIIPMSLIEAARIDGASEWAIFHRLILPTVLPGLAPILVVIFLQSWNSYLVPLLVLNDNSVKTIPLVVTSIQDRSLGNLSAAFSMLTMVALVLLLARLFRPINVKDGLHG